MRADPFAGIRDGYGDELRDSLRPRSESVDVWCERCQRVHASITFSREDYDQVIADGAQQIADHVDVAALEYAYRALGLKP